MLLLVSSVGMEEVEDNVLVTIGNVDFDEDVDELLKAFVFVAWLSAVDIVICPESQVSIPEVDSKVVVAVAVVVLIVCFVDVLFLEIKNEIVEIGLIVSI